jgi:outer membrane protein OmpA-like peptidoglycan-associated protein
MSTSRFHPIPLVCLLLLFVQSRVLISAEHKTRLLNIELSLADADKKGPADLSDALIQVTKSGKPFKKVISKGLMPSIISIPLDQRDYEITVELAGYKRVFYSFHSKYFDFSKVKDNEDYNAKLTIKMKKLAEGTNAADVSAATGDIEYNPETQSLEIVGDIINKPAPKQLVDYNSRFMITRKNKTKPEGLANGSVLLQDTLGAVLQTTKTSTTGDFAFHQLNPDTKYKVVLEKTKEVPDDAKVYMTKHDGTIIQKMEMDKSTNTFAYKLLPAELTKLIPLAEEDASIKVLNFSKSTDKEMNIVLYIYYDIGKWDISPEAAKKFDDIAEIMTKNPTFKLEVGSHTDSNGDDDMNMKLSEKRAETAVAYLVAKGIPKTRVTGKGYGETRLLNRCKNGVTCYEEEHAQNRRTEFRFIKTSN